MRSVHEYGELMQEALRWARTARTDAERERFLQIARAWEAAAALAERSTALLDCSAENAHILDPASSDVARDGGSRSV
jgi:hypothetical protein